MHKKYIIETIGNCNLNKAKELNKDLIALIKFNDKNKLAKVFITSSIFCLEHHELAERVGMSTDEYNTQTLRIFLNNDGASWLYNCPKNYALEEDFDKTHQKYYMEGIKIISEVIAELGYIVPINIPKRHLEATKAAHTFE